MRTCPDHHPAPTRFRVHPCDARTSFVRSEGGSLTIFSLFLFVILLMISGMAVDMIRQERARVAMQNTLDTAVLAASGVSQGMTPEEVVADYVSKAGFDATMVQISTTQNMTGQAVTSRSVSASVPVTTETMFMDMMGVSSLTSFADTAAEERNQKVEIALVLDVSGSMNWDSANPSVTKIQALKSAAKEFVETIFEANDPNDVSISIIPYNHQVFVPDTIMSRLSVNGGTQTVSPVAPYAGALTQYETANTDAPCIVFDSTDFQTRALTATGSVNRSASFLADQFYWAKNGVVQQAYKTPYEWAKWCNDLYPKIMPYSNNESDLRNYIDGLEASGATAINVGMNWGVAMLDPSFRPIVQDMVAANELDPEMDIYPGDYGNWDVQKFVVLMTDGANTQQYDLQASHKSGPTRIWHSAQAASDGGSNYHGYFVEMPNNSATQRWYKPGSPYGTGDDQFLNATALPADAVQLDYHELYRRFGIRSAARFFFEHSGDTAAYNDHFDPLVQAGFGTADANTAEICARAKQNNQITVFTVAFEAPAGGQAVLSNCATAPGYYFDVDGTQISDAFSAIANQIALLRLTE